MSYDLSEYVDVKTRIELFYKKFPEGSLQFEFKGTMPNNPEYIWGISYAYRHPEDPRPAMGTASELATGKTSFTRGSELANLETSCHGRSIGALGLGLGKSMATLQEVVYAQERQKASDKPAPQVDTTINGVELSDPWGEAATQLDALPETNAPKCQHGTNIWKEGVGAKTGKPFKGWFCPWDKCPPVWVDK